MSYLPFTKSIPVSINIIKDGVHVFADCECDVMVDFGIIEGELDFEITGFKFQDCKFDEGKRVDISATITRQDQPTFALLSSNVNIEHIQESLDESLSHSYDDDSGYVNRSWVTA
jgi:hypothetical protein